MSGPKSSYYTVTSEQRRKLAERRHREELERKRREEQERQRREEQEHQRRKELERQRREEQERKRREEQERRHREELERQRREEQERQRREELERQRREEQERQRREEQERQRRIELERQRREEQERQRREELERQRRIEQERQARIKQSDAVIDEAFADFQSPTGELDKNFNDTDLNPLITDLKIEYKIVCDMAGEPERPFEISQTAIQNIKAEIIRLRKKIARDDEKAYISKCLDEVMSDMGYDVIGRREVTKKSGKHFKSELFSYDDDTVVNVTMADDGRIAMELCGLDEVDRTPDLAESEKLCEHMETFCEDFGEIERRLEEKGVILSSRIQRLPPSVEYAQILNVSDYELNGTVEHFNHRRRRDKTSQLLHRKN